MIKQPSTDAATRCWLSSSLRAIKKITTGRSRVVCMAAMVVLAPGVAASTPWIFGLIMELGGRTVGFIELIRGKESIYDAPHALNTDFQCEIASD